ncbi:diguanylate cyclase (GGDEF) domain-containing protein [Propionivibrio dicarboxylicus]|uniref:diguanylate cyclase n=2 Tax=Propionivibrio dicarboxylicus TaxID=83767 RepID=A0A1G7VJR3_9RHOO|nr:diguanylate cyclase (GGDEF) domain-containing protein [Propionivibrio dicarboxylicus]
MGVDLYYSYQQRVAESRKELENLSIIIESNVLATLSKIDVVISETAYTFGPMVDGRKKLALLEANQELLRRMAYIPEAQALSLRVINADGRVVFNAGETAELPNVVVADRAYFLRHKSDPNAGLVLSEAILSRFTGKWLLTLSRRMVDAEGNFAGVVQAALRTEYFQGLFELVNVGADDSISLLDENKRLLARHPPRLDAVGQQFDQLAVVMHFPSDPSAISYRRGAGIDGVDRHYVIRNIGAYPYVLVVGRSSEAIRSLQQGKIYLYVVCYFCLALAFACFLWVYVRHQQELEKLATTDSLTGLKNRRIFDSTLEFMMARRVRNSFSERLSVALFDIDHFKMINDTRGHLKGDEVLRRVANVIRCRVRKTDLSCRWGGEEFIVLLNDCDIEQAIVVAENIRSAIADESMSYPDDGFRVTISAGVAEVAEGDTVDSLVKRADDALYQAKASGRNRVCR